MDAYIYQADCYCRSCGEKIKEQLIASGAAGEININDERSYDSGDFPKGPYGDGGGESDCPQHCGACFCFLENPLTSEGYQYVRDQANDKTSHSSTIKEWLDFYEIDLDE